MFKHSLIVSASLIALSSAAMAAEGGSVSPAIPAAAIPAPAAPAPVAAPVMAAPKTNYVSRQELPALIKEALMNDPEMIMDAVKKLKDMQAADAKKKTEEAIAKNKDMLVNDASAPSIGDAKTADVTMVEFFDYHCGYCRHLLPELTKLVKEDSKLRVVFVEFPILSEDSTAAARAALAVNRIAKDKYFDFHSALMKHEGKYDEKSLLDIAKKLGIDTAKLKAEMPKPEITAILDKNRQLGEEIGVRGTPALIVGNEFMPGAMPYEEMKKAVEAARGSSAAPAAPAAAAAPKDAPAAAPAVPTPAAPAAPAAPKPVAPPAPAAPAQ